MSKFENKDGSLTAYAFACGYIQTKKVNGIETRLSHSHSSYDVETWIDNNRVYWLSTESLTIARKIFKARCYKKAWAKLSDKERYVSGLTEYQTDSL